MKAQLNLLTDKECCYCGHSDVAPSNPDLFDGFFDADTKQTVCRGCKPHHYQVKNAGPHRNKYSETPIMALTYSK